MHSHLNAKFYKWSRTHDVLGDEPVPLWDYTWITTVKNGQHVFELWHDQDRSTNIHTYCMQQFLHIHLPSVKNVVTEVQKIAATSIQSIIRH
jgi:hypothetical protein